MRVRIADYDAGWPRAFGRHAARISGALGARALRIEHAGSTSVPGLAAKPVIDIVLGVADSADEASYAPPLRGTGYGLAIREPGWFEHRLFHDAEEGVNLHVFSAGCPEIERMLAFRDWLRVNSADRELYAETKRALARQDWEHMQNYADAKNEIVQQILARALAAR
jgi:GrpB-like predicted nucleotidyltransferase (UPF0157 family)